VMLRSLIAAALVLGMALPAAAEGEPVQEEPAPAPAPEAAPPAAPPDPLHVYVMTMGPGDHPFFRFGHSAIWIKDGAAKSDRVYNFGTFKFDSPRLIIDFLKGRLNYWLSVSSLERVVGEYAHENRSIAIQELNLTAAQKAALQSALVVNARPENRLYKYDYFLDNCSTRVRDAVDRVADGRLRASAAPPGRMTLRAHALRMTAQPLWLYVSLNLVLGPAVDRPIDRWTEMFLPEELARGLSDAQLVSAEQVLFQANRPPPRVVPPSWGPRFFLVGSVWGALMFALAWAGRLRRPARVTLGILVALWGFAVGFVGCFLVYAWAFTDHVVAHRNQNILLCAPWAIALVVFGVGVALGRPGATRKAFLLAATAMGAALIGCMSKVGIVPHQENGALVAFFLPAWLGITAALWTLRYATAFGTTRP
jgi:uncharacterized protein DUF4105